VSRARIDWGLGHVNLPSLVEQIPVVRDFEEAVNAWLRANLPRLFFRQVVFDRETVLIVADRR